MKNFWTEEKRGDMTQVEQLAAFVVRTRYEDLSEEARQQLKIRIIDALGCAIGALEGPPLNMLRVQLEDFGGKPLVTLIGGGKTAPDRAALYNSALVRYLDYNDSYIAKNETCHPSDNFGSVLASSEYAQKSGKEFLTALALAYQVQCRLSDVAPVRAKGFDHTTQGAYAVAAGVARALGLDQKGVANAVAMSGTAYNALRVTRTGSLSNWKGLAYPNTAFGATHAAFLAMRGMTGPPEVFEGNKGLMDAISGPFELDWAQENLEAVRRTSVKKYNAARKRLNASGSRFLMSRITLSAEGKRETSSRCVARKRPITVCPTWWPSRSWMATFPQRSMRQNGLCGRMCRACSAGSPSNPMRR